MMLTIFTPTYNRANLLERLYCSLLTQTNHNFEWIIIDDGSTDNTQDTVNKWIGDNAININYIQKPNGGKHTAYNVGVQNAKGDLCVCVDSDDYLSDDAVDSILSSWKNTTYSTSCAGIIGQKKDIHNTRFISQLPDGVELTLYQLDYEYKCIGDKCFIFRTDVAKEYTFPVVKNEKFFPESYLYDMIGKNHTFITLGKDVNICEYQQDGYSSGFINLMINNPTGFKAYYSQRIDLACTLYERMGYLVRYSAFDVLSRRNEYSYYGKYKFWVTAVRPLGWLLTKYYKHKNK